MSKNKDQKKELVNQYKELLSEKPNYFVVDTNGAGSAEITELKKSLRETGASFHVLKNTLFKIAAQEEDQPTQVLDIEGTTGIIVNGEDITETAKLLIDLQKEKEILETKFAVLFGSVENASKVKALAEIPSREVLLSKLVGSMQSPISGFMSVANGTLRNLLFGLKAIQANK